MPTLLITKAKGKRLNAAKAVRFGIWIVVAFAGLGIALPAAAQVPTAQNVRAVDRGSEYYNSTAAADAATEKALQSMSADFFQGGGTLVSNQISYYESLSPNVSDDPYWSNYLFTAPVSGAPGVWVGQLNAAQPVWANGQIPGVYPLTSFYRIAANAQLTNGGTGLTAAVWQDVALESLPLFSFAVFYNGTLEFSDCPTMTINGPVYCNTNLYVGCTSTATLTFNNFITVAGSISNPPIAGFTQGNWVASHVIYQGTPSPGYAVGQPVLTFPVGTNSLDPNSAREIINPPPAGESQTNPISSQRFYNKAYVIVVITNAYVPNSTNWALVTNAVSSIHTNAVFVTVKNSMYDPSPLIYAVTNGILGVTNGVNYTAEWSNWASAGFTNWLSLTNTFYDQRQSAYLHVVQIDVGKLGSWIGTASGCTNSYLMSKWTGGTPFNGIIYVQDLRNNAGSSNYQNCVRLVNGQNITNGLYQTGLTVATQNPLYIMGLYNCPSATINLSSTNTTGTRPCSVICDALTILSPNWQSGNYDSISAGFFTSRPAADDTVNTGIIAGNVPTTDTTAAGFSGGVQNLPRLLEDWTSANFWLNTSIVCLYPSVQASAQFRLPSYYYEPPTRHFSFDLNFLNADALPPGTPSLQTFVGRVARSTPSPTADPSQ